MLIEKFHKLESEIIIAIGYSTSGGITVLCEPKFEIFVQRICHLM
jgi:hypothetical protein